MSARQMLASDVAVVPFGAGSWMGWGEGGALSLAACTFPAAQAHCPHERMPPTTALCLAGWMHVFANDRCEPSEHIEW